MTNQENLSLERHLTHRKPRRNVNITKPFLLIEKSNIFLWAKFWKHFKSHHRNTWIISQYTSWWTFETQNLEIEWGILFIPLMSPLFVIFRYSKRHTFCHRKPIWRENSDPISCKFDCFNKRLCFYDFWFIDLFKLLVTAML